MSSIWKAVTAALVLSVALPVFSDTDFDEVSPEVLVVTFRSATAKDGAKVERVVASLRKTYAEKDVLFLEVDVSTKASAHQGRLLLGAIGVGSLYSRFSKKPGVAVVWDAYAERLAHTLTAETTVEEAVEAVGVVLDPPDEDIEDQMGDDG